MKIEQQFKINKYHTDRAGHKYGLYADNTTYSFPCYWAVCVSNGRFVSGNTFYELLCGLFNKEFKEHTNEFHDFIMSEFFDEENSLRFLEKVDDFSHKPDFNYYEVWAKLVVKHLYEMSAVSPYRYLKFDMNTGLGGQRFYFRGNSRQNILKSFKYHFRRTHHLKHLMKNNLNDWIFRFYQACIDFSAMRGDRYSFDHEAFINDCPFIRLASQEVVFKESNYYKRRELIV